VSDMSNSIERMYSQFSKFGTTQIDYNSTSLDKINDVYEFL